MKDGLEILTNFREKFADIPGFNWPLSEATWSFLLAQQNNSRITGHYLELGVFRGRSANLAAQFLSREELCILVDINDISDVCARISSYRDEPLIIRTPSDQLNYTDAKEYKGQCRLIHVDANHSGYAVIDDLNLSAEYVGRHGVICIDDFFSARYPQITQATYKWLDLNPNFKMILCGYNKSYIVHLKSFALYDRLIRTYFQSYMEGCGEQVSLAKTTCAHDMGCWGIIPKADRPVIGPDQDPDNVPY